MGSGGHFGILAPTLYSRFADELPLQPHRSRAGARNEPRVVGEVGFVGAVRKAECHSAAGSQPAPTGYRAGTELLPFARVISANLRQICVCVVEDPLRPMRWRTQARSRYESLSRFAAVSGKGTYGHLSTMGVNTSAILPHAAWPCHKDVTALDAADSGLSALTLKARIVFFHALREHDYDRAVRLRLDDTQ